MTEQTPAEKLAAAEAHLAAVEDPRSRHRNARHHHETLASSLTRAQSSGDPDLIAAHQVAHDKAAEAHQLAAKEHDAIVKAYADRGLDYGAVIDKAAQAVLDAREGK